MALLWPKAGGVSRFKFEDVLAVTDGHQQQGDGSYMVVCPSHDDRKPSLHVTEREGGYALLHCFVCEYKDVAKALESLGAKNGVPTITITSSRFSKTDVQEFADYCRVDPAFLRTLHPHLIFGQDRVGFAFPPLDVVKWRPGEGDKPFKWEPDGDRPPLWPGPDQSLPDTIYLTAGETDCICLKAAGFTAFALTKGEGTTYPVAVFEALKALGVGTIRYPADVDDTGGKAIPKLLAVIEEAGLVFEVLDLTPHLNPLLGEKDIRSLTRRVGVVKLKELIEAAATVTPEAWARSVDEVIRDNQGEMPWVVRPLVATGETTLFAGFPKAGKSTFVFKMVEQMREGGMLLDTFRVSKASVLIWSERSDRINAKRAEALFGGVNQSHVHFVSRSDREFRGRSFAEKARMVMQEAKRLNKDVLVIDTLAALAGITDENAAAEVQPFLDLLYLEAQRFEIAVVIIHHFNKAGRIRGSGTWEADPSTLVEILGEYQEPRKLKIRSAIETKVPDEITFTIDQRGQYKVVGAVDTPEAQAVLAILSYKSAEVKVVSQILELLNLDKTQGNRDLYSRTIWDLRKAGKVASIPVKYKGKDRDGFYRISDYQIVSSGGGNKEDK